jgi:hypothetical protein
MRLKASGFASICTAAVSLLAACSSQAPKKQTPTQPAAATQTELQSGDIKKDMGSVASQTAEVLQDSVARVLGFVDIYGKSVTVYQDTYSALYDNLGRQAATGAGTVADPLFYYSPVFVPDTPQLLLLPSGEVQIIIDNLANAKNVRKKISSKLSLTLKAYKIDADKVNILPLESVSGKLKAFAREYTVDVQRDLSRVTVLIPKTDIPKEVLKSVIAANGAWKSDKLLTYFSSMPISYTYWVQRFKEQDCHYNIDDSYVKNMFSSSEEACPKVVPPLGEVKTQAAQSGILNGLPGDKRTAVLSLVDKAKEPITACMGGQERSKLQARASVRCTKSATDINGKPNDYDAPIMAFLTKTIEPAIKPEVRLDPNKIENWDNAAMAAAVRMFGSPEAYESQIDTLNSEIQNSVARKTDLILSEASKNFLSKIAELGDSSADTKGNSSSNGVGGSIGFGGFGLGGNFSNSSASFEQALRTAVRKNQDTAANESASGSTEIIDEAFGDHVLEDLGGKLRFIPAVAISVKANIDKIQQAAASSANTDLGNIVVEKKEISAQFAKREQLSVEFLVRCESGSVNEFSEYMYIDQADWYQADAGANLWTALNAGIKKKLYGGSCQRVEVLANYTGAAANANMVPPTITFVVVGRVVGATPTEPGSVAFQRLELKSTNVGVKNSSAAKILEAPEGKAFSDILIEP